MAKKNMTFCVKIQLTQVNSSIDDAPHLYIARLRLSFSTTIPHIAMYYLRFYIGLHFSLLCYLWKVDTFT